MSKQKRPPQRSSTDKARVPESSRESAVSEQSSIGNQAVQAQLGPIQVQAPASDLSTVRAEALPVVERAMVALYTEPRAPDRVAKFVSVLESSKLPADRKATLIERVVSDQEAAVAVASAAERWFGDSGLEARTAALRAMDGLWASLEQSTPTEAHHGTTESIGSLGERADQLLGELARASAGEEMGEAIAGFCREVYLIVAWHHEEEEEEELGDAGAPEVE